MTTRALGSPNTPLTEPSDETLRRRTHQSETAACVIEPSRNRARILADLTTRKYRHSTAELILEGRSLEESEHRGPHTAHGEQRDVEVDRTPPPDWTRRANQRLEGGTLNGMAASRRPDLPSQPCRDA